MMRPPPGATPAQRPRTSAPQAERSTNNSSRGNIGRNTITVGAAGAAAGPAAALPPDTGAVAVAGVEPPPAALTACWQLGESLDLFFSRHSSAAAPPGGTPAQAF